MPVTKPVLGQSGWGAVLNAALDYLEDRGNHTGSQPASTIDGLDGVVADLLANADFTTDQVVGLNAILTQIADDISALEAGSGGPSGPITLASLPAGLTFAIRWSATENGWMYNGVEITERPTTRTDLIMLAFGGSASPTFMVPGDVWFEDVSA